MLKLNLLFGLFFLSSGCMSKEVNLSTVEYNPNLEPSCYIKFDETYWDWRDQLGASKDVSQDISLLLYSQGLFNNIKTSISVEKLRSNLCSKRFIFSENLAKAMNYYGPNAMPNDLYFFILNKFADKKVISKNDLQQVLIEGIGELEKRFEED